MSPTQMLEVGQFAPDFKLKGPGGQFTSLSDFRGKRNVVLVFYPLAFSPACAHHLPGVQKHMNAFRDAQAEVLGISVDSHYANEAFAEELGIDFPLLSDFHREASAAYGVLASERGTSGRAVFVIDKQGKLIHRELSPAPGDPDKEPNIERALAAIKAAR